MKILIPLSLFLTLSAANAKGVATCSLTVNREPCPGKETEAWYPYQGLNPTMHELQAKDQTMCLKMAQRSAAIARKGVLKKVTVSGTFSGNEFPLVVSEASCEETKTKNLKK